MMRLSGTLGLLVVTTIGCAGEKAPNGSCRGNADCQAGEICTSGRCATVCRSPSDCPAEQACTPEGLCVPRQSGATPVIETVVGNAPGEPTRVLNGMVLTGSVLAQATFELRGTGAQVLPLTVLSQSDTTAELIFPADIRSGAYTLVAANTAGEDQASVTLTLPELNGDEILTRLNQATGTVLAARLPVGANAGQVAAGNHDHTGTYAAPSHTHDAGAIATGTIAFARLPVGSGPNQVAAGEHGHAPDATRNSQTSPGASCQAINGTVDDHGSGLYWINPGGVTFIAYCEMDTLSGGWTLVMNVHPADGSIVAFGNTRFWLDELEYGVVGNRWFKDYKSPAAWLLAATNIMVQVAEPGEPGKIIGWKAWSMPAKSFDTFFDAAVNTTQTTAVLGSDVTNVYAYEPIIKNGTHLQSNRQINPNNDRIRLGADAYSAQGDDNSPGLGTKMNEASCPTQQYGCYRYQDVELWVNSGANLWTTTPAEGSFKWIGTDGGCGGSATACNQQGGPGYSPYWTYRIYVR